MSRKRLKSNRQRTILLASVLLLVLVGILLLRHSNKPQRQQIPITSPTPSSSQSSNSSGNPTPVSNDKLPTNTPTTPSGNSTPPNTTNKNVLTPSGTFVSNHHPSLSGSPELRQEQSVCYTSVGVSCYIEFSKDGQIKALPTKTTDSSGYAYWTWDVKDAGFSSGSWKIKAVAGSGDQTKTASDSLTLDVQP